MLGQWGPVRNSAKQNIGKTIIRLTSLHLLGTTSVMLSLYVYLLRNILVVIRA